MKTMNAETVDCASGPRVQRGWSVWSRVGLVLALIGSWAAYQLGAFVEPASPRDYIRQVETAAAQRNWLAPPALNVLELTRAAVDLWPNDAEIERMRLRVAALLAAESARVGVEKSAAGAELAHAARELDRATAERVIGKSFEGHATKEPPRPPGGERVRGAID